MSVIVAGTTLDGQRPVPARRLPELRAAEFPGPAVAAGSDERTFFWSDDSGTAPATPPPTPAEYADVEIPSCGPSLSTWRHPRRATIRGKLKYQLSAEDARDLLRRSPEDAAVAAHPARLLSARPLHRYAAAV